MELLWSQRLRNRTNFGQKPKDKVSFCCMVSEKLTLMKKTCLKVSILALAVVSLFTGCVERTVYVARPGEVVVHVQGQMIH